MSNSILTVDIQTVCISFVSESTNDSIGSKEITCLRYVSRPPFFDNLREHEWRHSTSAGLFEVVSSKAR